MAAAHSEFLSTLKLRRKQMCTRTMQEPEYYAHMAQIHTNGALVHPRDSYGPEEKKELLLLLLLKQQQQRNSSCRCCCTQQACWPNGARFASASSNIRSVALTSPLCNSSLTAATAARKGPPSAATSRMASLSVETPTDDIGCRKARPQPEASILLAFAGWSTACGTAINGTPAIKLSCMLLKPAWEMKTCV